MSPATNNHRSGGGDPRSAQAQRNLNQLIKNRGALVALQAKPWYQNRVKTESAGFTGMARGALAGGLPGAWRGWRNARRNTRDAQRQGRKNLRDTVTRRLQEVKGREEKAGHTVRTPQQIGIYDRKSRRKALVNSRDISAKKWIDAQNNLLVGIDEHIWRLENELGQWNRHVYNTWANGGLRKETPRALRQRISRRLDRLRQAKADAGTPEEVEEISRQIKAYLDLRVRKGPQNHDMEKRTAGRRYADLHRLNVETWKHQDRYK